MDRTAPYTLQEWIGLLLQGKKSFEDTQTVGRRVEATLLELERFRATAAALTEMWHIAQNQQSPAPEVLPGPTQDLVLGLVKDINNLKAEKHELETKLAQTKDCGEGNVCGNIKEQCQKCLRSMFDTQIANEQQARYQFSLIAKDQREAVENWIQNKLAVCLKCKHAHHFGTSAPCSQYYCGCRENHRSKGSIQELIHSTPLVTDTCAPGKYFEKDEDEPRIPGPEQKCDTCRGSGSL